jgi:hypothetical protein
MTADARRARIFDQLAGSGTNRDRADWRPSEANRAKLRSLQRYLYIGRGLRPNGVVRPGRTLRRSAVLGASPSFRIFRCKAVAYKRRPDLNLGRATGFRFRAPGIAHGR